MLQYATQKVFISIMHFLMAKLHVIIEPEYQPVLSSVQSMQQCQPIVDIQENYLINIQDGSCLMEPMFKNKLHESPATSLSPTLKTNKSHKRKRKLETKWILLSKM